MPATGVRCGHGATSRPSRPRSTASTWPPGRSTPPAGGGHDGSSAGSSRSTPSPSPSRAGSPQPPPTSEDHLHRRSDRPPRAEASKDGGLRLASDGSRKVLGTELSPERLELGGLHGYRPGRPLLPSLAVDADDEEPQAEHSFAEERGELDPRDQVGRDPRCQHVGEAV